MDKRQPLSMLREMLREQLCCLGRVVARHQVPDDVIWEIAKGFDVIYQQARCQIEVSPDKTAQPSFPHRLEPHPGLIYLLDKLGYESTATACEANKG
ncbi:MAG: hypothetical protein ACE5GL_06355 [Calditrichia bacterium]